jgi:hypothetical protein
MSSNRILFQLTLFRLRYRLAPLLTGWRGSRSTPDRRSSEVVDQHEIAADVVQLREEQVSPVG